MRSGTGGVPYGTRTPSPADVLAAAGLIALIASFAPPVAGMVSAADDFLRLGADATYRVDPGDRLVRVQIDFDATNLRPNAVGRTSLTTTTRYHFDRIVFAVPAEARSLQATSAGRALTTSVQRDRYRRGDGPLPNLFYRASRAIRVEFTLPGGKPRSTAKAIRVGSAFTTFTAWAWGDGTVDRSDHPADRFRRRRLREDVVERPTRPRRDVDRHDPPPGRVVSRRRRGSADCPHRLAHRAGRARHRREAWPRTPWRDRVADVLEEGCPLEELVGLPWPVSGDLSVSEVQRAAAPRYAVSTMRAPTRSR